MKETRNTLRSDMGCSDATRIRVLGMVNRPVF